MLPGVTVEAASPALIEKVRTVTTDGEGRYNIVDLRPGSYTVTFSITGFNSFKRDGIELPSGFTATVNADLKIGALSETVTVTGVKTSADLRHARVFVSVLGSERKRELALQGLEAAHSVLQGRIARELRMKRTPQLAFEYDPSVERGVRMTKLIDELAPDDSE